MPTLIDDEMDGDEGIAHALWTPVQGIPWDRASFQVCRTVESIRNIIQGLDELLRDRARVVTPAPRAPLGRRRVRWRA